MRSKYYARITLALCLLAAVFYNSWPLGYILDNSTAHYGLASDLELVHHPYFWLFVLGDILTAVCVLSAVTILWFKFWPPPRPKAAMGICAGMLLFGLFTAASALLPSQCTVTPVLRCGAGGGKGFGLDALISGAAALGLLVALIGLNLKNSRDYPGTLLAWTSYITSAAWSASGIIFIKFALGTGNTHMAQYALLILSGLAILMIGASVAACARPEL